MMVHAISIKSNNEAGVQALIEQLLPLSAPLVVVESTGGLERLLVSSLQAVSIAVAIANPQKVKGFAIALGKAKTDKLDAQVIARFAETLQPRPQPVVAPKVISHCNKADLLRMEQMFVA